MFSVFCKNIQTSVGHMFIKGHSDSADAHLIANKLHHIKKPQVLQG